MVLVLALIDERRPPPAGVQVLARVLATGTASGRLAVEAGASQTEGGSMLLTFDEGADELRLSRRQVERLAASGKLPTVTVGSARRVRRSDFEQYVANLGQPVGAAR